MRIALLALFLASTATVVSAQTAAPADHDLNRGLLRSLDTADKLQETRRERDSILNGALIGAGAGVASGLFLCRTMEPWEVCRDDIGPMLKFAALGAGIGIGIDLLIGGRDRSDERSRSQPAARLHAAPLVGRRAGGVQLSMRF